MTSREVVKLSPYPKIPLSEAVEFLDHLRRPIKEQDRTPGPFPYFGANGKQGTIGEFIFDEPLVLLAEDGGHFSNPQRGIAYKVEGKCWVNNHAHVLRPRPLVDINFLFRVLQNYDVTPYITGTTRAKLTKAGASEIDIPLPPLEEQRQIAAILDKADALRKKRKQTIALLDSLAPSAFLEMFGDPIRNTMNWKVKPLQEVADTRLGKMLDQKKMAGLAQFPYLANLNVQWNNLVLDNLRTMGFSDSEQREFALQVGDLLVCEGGEIGRCAIWHNEIEHCFFQKALHRVRCDAEECTPEYLLWYFWHMSKNGALAPHTSTATISHLTGIKLRQLPIPIPPIASQQRFSKFVSKIRERKSRIETSARAIEALFSSIQNHAFAGDLQ